MKHTIMIVDDSLELRNVLKLYLENAGYLVLEAVDGQNALEQLSSNKIDLMILDIMMPRMDGFELLDHLNKLDTFRNFPIIFLSARTQIPDKIRGLTSGADDYIEKPFDPSEVIARVMVVLKRCQKTNIPDTNQVQVGDLVWNSNHRKVFLKGELLELRAKEYKLLTLFMRHPGRIFTKQEIYEFLWEDSYYNDDNTIMVHMSNLREKIEEYPKKPERIITIRNLGYMLKKDGD